MDLDRIKDVSFTGRVTSIQGLLVEIAGVERYLSIGSRVRVQTRDRREVECEVVGFRQNRALLMPYGSLEGVGLGRSEEHTSELQSLMRNSYAVFCLKKKKKH